MIFGIGEFAQLPQNADITPGELIERVVATGLVFKAALEAIETLEQERSHLEDDCGICEQCEGCESFQALLAAFLTTHDLKYADKIYTRERLHVDAKKRRESVSKGS